MSGRGDKFPSSARLRGPEAFRHTLHRGRRRRGLWFVVSTSPAGSGRSRLGIVVSRRVVPLAVERNALKRTIREAYRRIANAFPSLNVVVQVHRRPTAAGERKGARDELRQLLETIAK